KEEETLSSEKQTTDGTKDHWKRLKALSGNEDVKNPLPSTAMNEDNEFVLDKAGVEEVWARCFEKLGQHSDSKGEYNEEFISGVEQSVKEAVEQDNKLPSILDRPLELAEVQRAIKRLRRGKAVGLMNEIFMYGGDKVVEATWRLCEEVFEVRTEVPQRLGARTYIPSF